MSAQDQRIGIAMPVDELRPRLDGEGLIDVGLLAPLRFGDLYGVDHHVTGDDGFPAVGAQAYAIMPRRVARRRDERDFVVDAPGVLHPLHLAGLDDRQDILPDYGLIRRVGVVLPMFPLAFV